MQKPCENNGCDQRGTPDSCRLNQLGIGCKGCVVSVGGDYDLRRRLLEMGFCNGVQVEVIRRAPLGDPSSSAFAATICPSVTNRPGT